MSFSGLGSLFQLCSLLPSLAYGKLFFSSSYHHTIIGATLAILAHLSAASAATGPLISVPFNSPSGVTITAALSSKLILIPPTLLIGYFCLTITACSICFFRSGGPFFTTAITRSATLAAGILLNLPLNFTT